MLHNGKRCSSALPGGLLILASSRVAYLLIDTNHTGAYCLDILLGSRIKLPLLARL